MKENEATIPLPPEIEKVILKFLEVAKNYPLSKRGEQIAATAVDSASTATCPHSGEQYPASEIEILQDQIGPIKNLLHPKFRKDVAGMCPVVCIRCREVVSWLAPGKDEEGFQREKGKLYHIQHCPKCDPEAFEGKEVATELIEKQLWRKYK